MLRCVYVILFDDSWHDSAIILTYLCLYNVFIVIFSLGGYRLGFGVHREKSTGWTHRRRTCSEWRSGLPSSVQVCPSSFLWSATALQRWSFTGKHHLQSLHNFVLDVDAFNTYCLPTINHRASGLFLEKTACQWRHWWLCCPPLSWLDRPRGSLFSRGWTVCMLPLSTCCYWVSQVSKSEKYSSVLAQCSFLTALTLEFCHSCCKCVYCL